MDLVIKGLFLLAASSSASVDDFSADFDDDEHEVVAAASDGTAPSGTETCNSPDEELRTITWVRFVPALVPALSRTRGFGDDTSLGMLASDFLVAVSEKNENKLLWFSTGMYLPFFNHKRLLRCLLTRWRHPNKEIQQIANDRSRYVVQWRRDLCVFRRQRLQNKSFVFV